MAANIQCNKCQAPAIFICVNYGIYCDGCDALEVLFCAACDTPKCHLCGGEAIRICKLHGTNICIGWNHDTQIKCALPCVEKNQP